MADNGLFGIEGGGGAVAKVPNPFFGLPRGLGERHHVPVARAGVFQLADLGLVVTSFSNCIKLIQKQDAVLSLGIVQHLPHVIASATQEAAHHR